MDDPNYRIEGVPSAIRGKITQLMKASAEAALAGSMSPELADEVREYELVCRRNLEQTIVSKLIKQGCK